MFKRNIMVAAAMATASIGAVMVAAPTSMNYPAGVATDDPAPRPRRRGSRIVWSQSMGRYRSKGEQAHAKRRSNRMTLSRRTRRKHRRAA